MRVPRTLCSIQVNNPGGSSGAATVQTDGVTIQGDGSTGSKIAIKAVQTDATLTGAGTVASNLSASPIQNSDNVTLQGNGTSASKYAIKAVTVSARLTGTGAVGSGLDIAGWPITGFTYSATTVDPQSNSANQTTVYGFALPFALTFSKITFYVATADGSNNSDVGLYNAAGTLIADIGAQHLSSTGAQTIATVQGSQTIAPGLYWMAFTSVATTLRIYGNNSQFGLGSVTNAGATSGGALSNSISAPSVSPLRQTLAFTLSV